MRAARKPGGPQLRSGTPEYGLSAESVGYQGRSRGLRCQAYPRRPGRHASNPVAGLADHPADTASIPVAGCGDRISRRQGAPVEARMWDGLVGAASFSFTPIELDHPDPFGVTVVLMEEDGYRISLIEAFVR